MRKICLCTIIFAERRIFTAQFVDLRNMLNLYFRKYSPSFFFFLFEPLFSLSLTSAFYYHKQFEKHSSQFLCPFLLQTLRSLSRVQFFVPVSRSQLTAPPSPSCVKIDWNKNFFSSSCFSFTNVTDRQHEEFYGKMWKVTKVWWL